MESNNENIYLVPFDFTSVTQDALNYALNLAHLSKGKILLAHIVKHDEEKIAANIRLENFIDGLASDDKEIVSGKVMVGDIFHEIDKIGDKTEASAIVMGTHGANRFQKLFGSNALKVVSSSTIPFIITQEGHSQNKIDSIVMPFSFAKESVQVTEFVSSLAEKYDATIHLVGYRDKDEWLLRDMKANQNIVRRHLTEHKVKHEIVTLPGEESYEKELMAYAKKVDADLIAAAYFSTGVKSLFHSFLQELIMNDQKVPVITINASEVLQEKSGFFSY